MEFYQYVSGECSAYMDFSREWIQDIITLRIKECEEAFYWNGRLAGGKEYKPELPQAGNTLA